MAARTRRKKLSPPGPPAGFHELNKLALKFNVGSFQCEILHWGHLAREFWRNFKHVHTYYEICYAYEGTGTFETIDKIHTINPGEVFVAKPSEGHEIIGSKTNPLGIYFWSYTLVPPPVAPRSEEPIDRLMHAFIDSTCWVSSRVPGMHRTLQLIFEEMAQRRPGYVTLVEGLVRKLVIDTARAVTDETIASESPLPRTENPERLIVERATRYMRDNFARALAVSEVAGQVSLSERHLNRLFHKHADKSPLELLTEIRVESASQLLLDKTLAIKDIAARVGYPDVRYFTTVFRQATHVTPAAYRARGGTRWVDPNRTDNRGAPRNPRRSVTPPLPGETR
jgi:AraC-like DNA-binding protein/mannose-6-phosphate isomerase-like protein (cupin superfamily)